MIRSIFIEVSDEANWGKFLVGQFSEAGLLTPSQFGGGPLLEVVASRRRAGSEAQNKRLVCDLQTEEGLLLDLDGDLSRALDRHQIWVCPLMAPFLCWLQAQGPIEVEALPKLVELPAALIPKLQGWRRPGSLAAAILPIRQKLLTALQQAARLPVSPVQAAVFIDEQLTPEESCVWTLYRNSLSEQDRNRWLGALLVDSGRFVAAAVLGGQIGLVPV